MGYMCLRVSGKECDCCMECRGGQSEISCPECGSTICEYLYYKDGEVIGCDDCIERRDFDE